MEEQFQPGSSLDLLAVQNGCLTKLLQIKPLHYVFCALVKNYKCPIGLTFYCKFYAHKDQGREYFLPRIRC